MKTPLVWWGLLAVATLDMISSYWWLHTGQMTESNPFMAWCVAQGLLIFLVVKSLTFLPALLILRALPQKYEAVATLWMKRGLIVYILIWCFGTAAPVLAN
jgi:hypothetical protein